MKQSLKITTSLSRTGAMLGAFAILAMPSVAQAQLDEVVTTAQRRVQNVQDIAVSVSSYNAETLEAYQIDEPLDLVNSVPNLFGGNNTGLGTANQYYLRGQGQDESFATFDPAVGTYVDEVYVSRQNANNMSLFDVERIEVLRGPQGTLFGRNTSGGAVNITLAKPAEEFGGYVEVGYGRFNEVLARGTVDSPMSDNVRTKVSAFYNKDNGWLRNTTSGERDNDKDSFGVRAAVSVDISEALLWDVTADYVDANEANATGGADPRSTASTLATGVPISALVPGAIGKADAYGNSAKSFNLTSNLQLDTGNGEVNFILGYRDLAQDFLINFPLPNFTVFRPATSEDEFVIDNLGDHEQFSAELKYNTSLMDDRLNLTTGLYYINEDNVTDVAAYFVPFNSISRDRVVTNTSKGFAVYGQGDFDITDALTLTAGLRWTDETKEIELSDNRPVGDATDLTTANLVAAGIETKINESVLTPRFALSYDVNDDTLLFASATRGFRTGGWSARGGTAAAVRPFKSEFIWSYEAGLKKELWDNRLRANLTGFYSDLKDLQINASDDQGNFSITNAGGLQVLGLEAELVFQPVDNVNMFAALGLQDAEYVDTEAQQIECNAAFPTGGQGIFGALAPDCSVATVKRSPEYTFAFGGSVDIDVGNGWTITPKGSARFVGQSITTSRNRGPSEAQEIFNAGISLSPPSNAWSATAECKNCTGDEYLVSTFGSGDVYLNEPATWQLRLQYNFGAR